ncbi:unnamed protein product [Gongylonema pulchrum]|uniref:Transmembrane protein n=1 Tax=Gongylonema pulchrum TaxID=637853 RepID=A0A183CYE3_9BILA|nr:unnamed protein product [Gongylonema pulchrum]
MLTRFLLYFVALLTVVKLTSSTPSLHVEPREISLTIGEDTAVRFYTTDELRTAVEIALQRSSLFDVTPYIFQLDNITQSVKLVVTGLKITSYAVLAVEKCTYVNETSECPFTNLDFAFASVKVVHSRALSIAVIVVGWIYFVAWSISFYPQIYLNFKRKRVFWIFQEIYEKTYPHSLIPVLMNDVVFAAHALLACLFTALQCFIYKRGNQRVSYTCWGLSSLFGLVAVIALALTLFNVINGLHFIMTLSYIKMAVTLCKYFPQAYMNFRRKSTVGWSIGNVLLDFLGGCMDIVQMILQGANTG